MLIATVTEEVTIVLSHHFLLSLSQAARNNVLLAVPAFLYAINNYLKFIMQVKVLHLAFLDRFFCF